MADRLSSLPNVSPTMAQRPKTYDRPSIHYHYPPVPTLKQPPAAHVKRWSEGQVSDTTRVQSSVSSGGSVSTAGSYHKSSYTSDNYWPSPATPKAALADDPERDHAQWKRTYYPPHVSTSRAPDTIGKDSIVTRYGHEPHRYDNGVDETQDHAIWVLFWLSLLDPSYSLVSCFYTIFVLIALVVVTPIRLLKKTKTFSDQMIRTLAGPFRNHLQLIYAASVDDAHTFDFSPTRLVLVLLISPLVSFGVSVAAWVSAAFWGFAIIMGNPDGTEKRDDGRDTVLYVRNWWESYFLYALRKQRKNDSVV